MACNPCIMRTCMQTRPWVHARGATAQWCCVAPCWVHRFRPASLAWVPINFTAMYERCGPSRPTSRYEIGLSRVRYNMRTFAFILSQSPPASPHSEGRWKTTAPASASHHPSPFLCPSLTNHFQPWTAPPHPCHSLTLPPGTQSAP